MVLKKHQMRVDKKNTKKPETTDRCDIYKFYNSENASQAEDQGVPGFTYCDDGMESFS